MSDEPPANAPKRPLSPVSRWRKAIGKDSGLTAPTRHVALVVSLHMNSDGGSAFPSASTLAEETALSERCVRTSLKTLTDSGWLIVVKPGGGRRRSTHYRAGRIPPPNAEGHSVNDMQGLGGKGAPDDSENPETLHLTTRKGAPGAGEVVKRFQEMRGRPSTVICPNGSSSSELPEMSERSQSMLAHHRERHFSPDHGRQSFDSLCPFCQDDDNGQPYSVLEAVG